MPRVLIVDDTPSYVQALQVALGAEGFEVVAALDGKGGLERFRATRPDVLLLDLMLPGLTGLGVLREVRRLSDLPVIVVSAKGAEADIVSALELGADDYVTKPYSARELIARLPAPPPRGRGLRLRGGPSQPRPAHPAAAPTPRSRPQGPPDRGSPGGRVPAGGVRFS